MEGPLIGGTGLLGDQTAFSSMAVRGAGALAARGRLDAWFDISALTCRRASSKLPHIPQKRKVSELSSPHFGQITLILRIPLSLTLLRSLTGVAWHSFVHIRMPVSDFRRCQKATTKSAPPAQSFEARLERTRSRLNWVVIHIPFDAAKVWGLRGQIRVKGEINGFGFRSTLFPTGADGHILIVNKRMQKAARVRAGSVARFQMEMDRDVLTVIIPEELERILRQNRTLRRWYNQLNPSTRKDIAWWIGDVKTGDARSRRAEQMAERLLAVMEAERELPPLLQVAFAGIPRAREGREAMSAARRSGHVFGLFYYRNPEARGRRVDKMLEDAAALAE